MTPLTDPARTRQFLSTFATALRDGLPVPPAFTAAATSAGYSTEEAAAYLSLRSLEGRLTASLLLTGLVTEQVLNIIRSGEKEADVIGHLDIAAASIELSS